jgi:hypothetical protein
MSRSAVAGKKLDKMFNFAKDPLFGTKQARPITAAHANFSKYL